MSRNYSELFDKNDAEMLEDMDYTITKLNLWDWMKTYEHEEGKGFMFSSDPNIELINKTMIYGGYSGSSYWWTMRIMEKVAKQGWEDFRYEQLAENQLEGTEEFTELNDLLCLAKRNKDYVYEEHLQNIINRQIINLAKELREKDKITPMAVANKLRTVLPDGEQQYQAMKQFSEGKIDYATMRGLCG